MSITIAIIVLLCGLCLLWKCADLLVDGAVSIADTLGISPLVIGMTVVAIGTSAPEMAASISAVLHDSGEMAIGNIYGSNIANIGLVGGICALIFPISIQFKVTQKKIMVLLFATLCFYPILHNLWLGRIEGIFLLALFFGFIFFTLRSSRKESSVKPATVTSTVGTASFKISYSKSIIFILVGLGGTIIGADLTVRSAIVIGKYVGLSNTVIGITIIAIGTSLPELVTCVVASSKKQPGIVLGNIIGSNIFNILLVGGFASLLKPFSIEQRLISVDYLLFAGFAIIFSVMTLTAKRITRIEGVILLVGYIGYIGYIFGFTSGV